MRNRFLSSVAALAASAGLAWGQGSTPGIAVLSSDPVAIGNGPIRQVEGVGGLGNGPVPITILQPGIIGGAIPSGTDPVGIPSNGGPSYPVPANFGPLDLTGQAPPVHPIPGGGKEEHKGGLPIAYVNLEYLLYFMKGQPSAYPLATTGAPLSQGILGEPTTFNLLGGEDIGFGVVSGFRATAGVWCDPKSRVALEFSGFALEKQSEVLDAISSVRGVPLLARPYVDSTTGRSSSLLAAFPELAAGTINVVADTQVWGAEGNTVFNVYRSKPDCVEGWSLNTLAGFRYIQVQEQLAIGSGSNVLDGNTIPFAGLFVAGPTVVGVSDQFLTRNEFYGGQLGFNADFHWSKCTFSIGSKALIGNMHQRLDINGFSNLNTGTIDGFGQPQFQSTSVLGGLYATARNIGRYTHDEFTVIPEVNFNFGCQMTHWLRASVGYNFLYFRDIARPADQINPLVDVSQVPASFAYGLNGFTDVGRPATIKETDFWIQGLNFGLTFTY